jgi:hypothetical protein
VAAHLPGERAERVALALLVGLLAAGAALRLGLMLAYRPAFVGFPDVGIYIDSARTGVFKDALDPPAIRSS